MNHPGYGTPEENEANAAEAKATSVKTKATEVTPKVATKPANKAQISTDFSTSKEAVVNQKNKKNKKIVKPNQVVKKAQVASERYEQEEDDE